jgi:hypothetical protein
MFHFRVARSAAWFSILTSDIFVDAGYFKGPSDAPKEGGRNTPFLTLGREEKVSAVLDKVAKRHNVPLTAVAIAYTMQKVSVTIMPLINRTFANSHPFQTPYLFPILGGRKVEHLKANIEALSVDLTADDIAEIETGYEFDLGFPSNFLCPFGRAPNGPQDVGFTAGMGHFDYVTPPQPIKAHKG